MRAACSLALSVATVLALVVGVQAAEKSSKQVTLKGTITCAKCDLKESEKCATVIKVQEDGKDVIYYFDPAGKNPHKDICTEAKMGSVTGTVSEKSGKKWVKVSKVEFE